MDESTRKLHEAICNNDANVVKRALEEGADIHAFREDQYSPLSFIDDTGVLRPLLDAGADPNHAKQGESCDILYWAASAGRLDIIKMLIAAGATVESELVDYGNDPFGWDCSVHVAVERGDLEIVKCLLDAGGKAALNHFDYVCRTPLMIAVERGDVKAIELLVQAGADVNAHDVHRHGSTALNLAVKNQSIQLVQLLLNAGANPQIPALMGTALHVAKSRQDAIGPQIVSLLEAAIEKR
jgi:ankyrin repeat protein